MAFELAGQQTQTTTHAPGGRDVEKTQGCGDKSVACDEPEPVQADSAPH